MNETLTLLELNSLVRQVVERTLNREYWVEAELSECRESRGHCYMELVQKDPSSNTPVARAQAKCWRNTWMLLQPHFERTTGQQLHAGLKVRLRVYAQFHEAYGFSWIVTDLDPNYTMGDLARRRQEIIRQLKAEGVFDMQKELQLPLFCLRIAVISSATAAGYGDFVNQLSDSPFAFETQLFPATMQGEQVEQSVIAALDNIYSEEVKVKSEEVKVKSEEVKVKSEEVKVKSEGVKVKSEEFATAVPSADGMAVANSSLFTLHSSLLPLHSSLLPLHSSLLPLHSSLFTLHSSLNHFDAVVIIRGGGATADLSGFDTLALAENVAQFPLPIITGIGHDRDESILDMVSHTRVKTPTAAAQLLISHAEQTLRRIETCEERAVRYAQARMETERLRMVRLSERIPPLFSLFRTRQETRLDQLLQRLVAQMQRKTDREYQRLENLSAHLPPLTAHLLDTHRHRLQMLEQRAKALDPALLLRRGYSITLVGGHALRSPAEAPPGTVIETRLEQGKLYSIVT